MVSAQGYVIMSNQKSVSPLKKIRSVGIIFFSHLSFASSTEATVAAGLGRELVLTFTPFFALAPVFSGFASHAVQALL